MKDFNNYTGNNGSGASESKSTDMYKTFFQLAKKYEGKSSEEMIQAIILEAEKSRKNGTLTDRDIDNFVSTVSPLLNDSQRKMLYLVADKIKKS